MGDVLKRGILACALCVCLTGVTGAFPSAALAAGAALGPFGPEGPRMREQFWLLPGADPEIPLRATVFRPLDQSASGDSPARRPLVVINHGTDAATRESVSMPVFYWLSRWFVERGYAVVLPQRRGHGATGGPFAEAADSCFDPDHYRAGQMAADDIEPALKFMASQPFIDASRIVVAGVSSGGWASLALGARTLPGVRAIINFAGGRGAYAWGRRSAVCGADQLVAAAAAFGRDAAIPTLWLYARNDHSFGPALAKRMAGAWSANGGSAEFHLLGPYGADGHALADDHAGWRLWGSALDGFLTRHDNPKEHPEAGEIASHVSLAN